MTRTPPDPPKFANIPVTPATIALAVTLLGNIVALAVNYAIYDYRLDAMDVFVQEYKRSGLSDRLTRIEAREKARDDAINRRFDRMEKFELEILHELRND